jgi:D-tyrosyl-tRNA(Tyr) deacylase
LYEEVCRLLREEHQLPVKTGVFGAMMLVEIINDGPVTLIVRSERSRTASPAATATGAR